MAGGLPIDASKSVSRRGVMQERSFVSRRGVMQERSFVCFPPKSLLRFLKFKSLPKYYILNIVIAPTP
jgi:hypothetical protein